MDEYRNLYLIVGGEKRDSITLTNPSISLTSSLLAYRPRYQDVHKSHLAGLFVNIKGVFPCISSIQEYEPVCRMFTKDEDGFRKGKQFIEMADTGNDIRVFGSNSKPVYGIAVQGCEEFTDDCFSIYLRSEVVCMLPRSKCT